MPKAPREGRARWDFAFTRERATRNRRRPAPVLGLKTARLSLTFRRAPHRRCTGKRHVSTMRTWMAPAQARDRSACASFAIALFRLFRRLANQLRVSIVGDLPCCQFRQGLSGMGPGPLAGDDGFERALHIETKDTLLERITLQQLTILLLSLPVD